MRTATTHRLGTFYILGLCLSLLLSLDLRADHLEGGFIEYSCLGNGEFLITLNVYQDCINPDTAQTENMWVIRDNGSFFTETLSLISSTVLDTYCESMSSSSICEGGLDPGRRLLRYQGIVLLDGTSLSYRLRWSANYRAPSDNVNSSENIPFYVHSIIYMGADNCDDSPILLSRQAPNACVGQESILDFAIQETEADSLHFALTGALQSTSSNDYISLPYLDGFTGSEPVPGASIDPQTGVVTYTPEQQGAFTFAILIEQYNTSDELIGLQVLDYLVHVLPCPDGPGQISSEFSTLSGEAVFVAPDTLEVCAGSSFCLDYSFISSADVDGISVSSNAEELMSNVTLSANGANPIIASLCGTASLDSLDATLILQAQDDICPFPSMGSRLVHVRVRSCPTHAEMIHENKVLSLYPNPLSSMAILDLGELRGFVQLEIYDLTGGLLRNQSLSLDSGSFELERGDLARGIYLLRIHANGERRDMRFAVE